MDAFQGEYIITAPAFAKHWRITHGPLVLRLAPSSTHGHLWGSFSLHVFEEFIRPPSIRPMVESHFAGEDAKMANTCAILAGRM